MINIYNQDSGMCRFVSDSKLNGLVSELEQKAKEYANGSSSQLSLEIKNGVAKIPHAPFSGDEAILLAIEYSKEKGHHVVSYF